MDIMKKRGLKKFAAGVTLLLALGLLAGCGGEKKEAGSKAQLNVGIVQLVEHASLDAANKGIGSDGYSNMVELRMTVRVNFVDKANPKNNFNNQQFSASREYKSSQQLSSVQDELVNQMIKDIVDQIFNMTVANW